MIILTSPAKTLDYTNSYPKNIGTPILFPKGTSEVIVVLKTKTATQLRKVLHVSEKLADLNFERYQKWEENKSIERPALFAYNGDIYQELFPHEYTKDQLDYLQKHLRIISGVYGLIRPFDLMRPYRLEMKANLKVGKHRNLYEFWTKQVTQYLQENLSEDDVIVDLASNEYVKHIDFKSLKPQRIKVEFRQIKNGKVENMGIQDKIARGQMIDFMAKHMIEDIDKLKEFHTDGYEFQKRQGDEMYFITKFVSKANRPNAI